MRFAAAATLLLLISPCHADAPAIARRTGHVTASSAPADTLTLCCYYATLRRLMLRVARVVIRRHIKI